MRSHNSPLGVTWVSEWTWRPKRSMLRFLYQEERRPNKAPGLDPNRERGREEHDVRIQ